MKKILEKLKALLKLIGELLFDSGEFVVATVLVGAVAVFMVVLFIKIDQSAQPKVIKTGELRAAHIAKVEAPGWCKDEYLTFIASDGAQYSMSLKTSKTELVTILKEAANSDQAYNIKYDVYSPGSFCDNKFLVTDINVSLR